MNDTKLFSFSRLTNLFRKELVLNMRSVLIASGAVFGLLLLINIASVSTWNQWRFHTVFYPLVLMIGGHVITSLSFRELHQNSKGYTFITLPASLSEKYLSKLLLTSLGYMVISLGGYFLFSLVAAGITQLFFGISHRPFNPFDPIIWDIIPIYLATHALTFFGAVFFKKLHLLNTILWITIVAIGVGFISTGIFRLIFWKYFSGPFSFTITDEAWMDIVANGDGSLQTFIDRMEMLSKVFLYAIMPAFFWITGFIRLRETEV